MQLNSAYLREINEDQVQQGPLVFITNKKKIYENDCQKPPSEKMREKLENS